MSSSVNFVETKPLDKDNLLDSQIFEVRLANGDHVLGTIQWFGLLRQYYFFPLPNTMFPIGCLQEISAFMVQQKKDRDTEHKKEKENKK